MQQSPAKRTAQQSPAKRTAQPATNGTSPKNRNLSILKRSSNVNEIALSSVEISLPGQTSLQKNLNNLIEPLPGQTSSSLLPSSKKAAKRTASSASQRATTTISPVSQIATASAVPNTVTRKKTPSVSPKDAKLTTTSTSAVSSIQTNEPSLSAKGLADMDGLAFDIILKELSKYNFSILNSYSLKKLKSKKNDFDLSLGRLLKNLTLQLPPIEQYLLYKIKTIDLDDIVIDDLTLNFLNWTVEYSKVSTIILRNITFKNNDVATKFLEYLENNTQIQTLILRKISMNNHLEKLLKIIGTLTNITLLEFSNFNVDNYFEHLFLRTLIKLEKLKHLIFNNNNISSHSYAIIFGGYYSLPIRLSSAEFGEVGIYFIDKHLIKTNLNDNTMTIYYNTFYTDKYMNMSENFLNEWNVLNNEHLKTLDNLKDFEEKNSLNFHAVGNYYIKDKRTQVVLGDNIDDKTLQYTYASVSIKEMINKLETKLRYAKLRYIRDKL